MLDTLGMKLDGPRKYAVTDGQWPIVVECTLRRFVESSTSEGGSDHRIRG